MMAYLMAFVVFVSMPLIFIYLKLGEGLLLPLNIKIFGLNRDSHPGYEFHYLFCICSIFNGGVVIGGE